VYVVPVDGGAVGVIGGDDGTVGLALGSDDGDADGAKVPPGTVDGEAAGVAHAARTRSVTKPSDARRG
jgi:hypothetical protein